MGAAIELWSYKLYENGSFYLEEVFQKTVGASATSVVDGKDPKMVAAGKKAAIIAANSTYSFEEHIAGKSEEIVELALVINDYVMGLDSSFERAPKKYWVAYKIAQNVVCMEIQKSKILLFLKLDPENVKGPAVISRNVSRIGHYGTGDLEVTIRNTADYEKALPFIVMAYQQVGG